MNDFLHSHGWQALSLQGFGPLLLQGTWMTLKLALLSLALSLALGLFGASAKLSRHTLLRVPATLYTTLIRSVPDLVLILLIFYTLQLWLNDLTDLLGWDYFEIDPFTAGSSPWALSMVPTSPRTFAARSSASQPDNWRPPRPTA